MYVCIYILLRIGFLFFDYWYVIDTCFEQVLNRVTFSRKFGFFEDKFLNI